MAETFAERLTQIRKSKKLSQSDLAGRIGVKTAAICHFETGHRKPTFDHLLKLADVLDKDDQSEMDGKIALADLLKDYRPRRQQKNDNCVDAVRAERRRAEQQCRNNRR